MVVVIKLGYFDERQILIVQSYVLGRTVTLNYTDSSGSKKMTKSCVQGSTCGVVFWNIILDELLSMEDPPILLPDGAHVRTFADDVLLIMEGRTREELDSTTNSCLDTIHRWGERVKYFANLKGRNRHEQMQYPHMRRNFLGVIIDR